MFGCFDIIMLNFAFYKTLTAVLAPIFTIRAVFSYNAVTLRKERSRIIVSDMEFTQEQIENIWRRVLADLHDPTGAFDPLMAAGNEGAGFGPKVQPVSDYRDDYDVYSDIENSVYGMPDEPQNRAAAPEEYKPWDACPQDRRRDEPDYAHEKQPGRRLLYETKDNDPDEKKKSEADYLIKHIPELISEQLKQCMFCRSLSRAAPNRRAARVLTLAANRNYSSAKNISSAFFMASGNYSFPWNDRRLEDVPYFRSSLRNAWKNEVSLTTSCTNSAEKTEDVTLMKVLLDAARGHAENAVELRRLIEQSLD